VHAQPVVGGDAGQVLERARAWVPRLSTRLNMSTGFSVTSTTGSPRRPWSDAAEAVLEFQARQVAGQQEIALDGAIFTGRSAVIRDA